MKDSARRLGQSEPAENEPIAPFPEVESFLMPPVRASFSTISKHWNFNDLRLANPQFYIFWHNLPHL
jgi:hypothetical protein